MRDRYNRLSISEQAIFDQVESSYTIGTPEQCWAEIEMLANEFTTQEISLVTVTHSQEHRLNSYHLLDLGR